MVVCDSLFLKFIYVSAVCFRRFAEIEGAARDVLLRTRLRDKWDNTSWILGVASLYTFEGNEIGDLRACTYKLQTRGTAGKIGGSASDGLAYLSRLDLYGRANGMPNSLQSMVDQPQVVQLWSHAQ